MELPTLSYIDGTLIDEVWMRLKKDGIQQERLNKAKATVTAKAKFGLGKLLSGLHGDITGELGGTLGGEETVKTTYAAPFRLVILRDLLGLTAIELDQHDQVANLRAGDFVEMTCPHLSLALLPRFGDFAHISLAFDLLTEHTKDENFTSKDLNDLFSEHILKFSAHPRATAFVQLLEQEDERNGPISRFHKQYSERLKSMMRLCSDNMIIGASLALRSPGPKLIPEEKPKSESELLAEARRIRMEDAQSRMTFLQGTKTGDAMARRRDERIAEETRKQEETRLALSANSDTLMVTCFKEEHMRLNVAALSATGPSRIFGKVLNNNLEDFTGTRIISLEPITHSIP